MPSPLWGGGGGGGGGSPPGGGRRRQRLLESTATGSTTSTGSGTLGAAALSVTSPGASSVGGKAGRPPTAGGAGAGAGKKGAAGMGRSRGGNGGGGGGEGVDEERRLAQAIKGWAFIVDMAQGMNLGKVATHTALVFFHRFFKHQSYEQHDRLLVAAACIYLAAKVEERNNCKLSLIVLHFLTREGHLPQDGVDLNAYGKHPQARELVPKWKERVILYERDLLYTINFDLNVPHPFKALQDKMKDVRDNLTAPAASSSSLSLLEPSVDHRTLFSQACKFLNDSFSLPSLVDAEPGYHAALALYLTLRVYGIPAPAGKTWLKILDVADSDESFARDCALAVRVLYSDEQHFPARLAVGNVPDPALVFPAVPAAAYGLGGASLLSARRPL